MPIYSKYTGVGGGTTYTFVGVTPITVTELLGTVTTSMTQADSTTDGWLSFTDWNTFNSKQNALTIGDLTSSDITVTGGTGAVIGSGVTLALTKGNLTGDTNAQISITGGTNAVLGGGASISQAAASASSNGYLTSADWSTFNSKQPAGSYANTDLNNLVTTSINQSLLFASDNTLNIGASTSNRPATINVGTGLVAPLLQARDVNGATGSSLEVRGGNALSGNDDGGDLTLRSGLPFGSGTAGYIYFTTGVTGMYVEPDGKVRLPLLTANRILSTNASSQITALNTTTYPSLTELSYVKGVTSDIQTQLNGKQPTGNYITDLTGEVTATGPGSVTATIAGQTGNNDKVLATNGTAVTWQYAGLGAGAFGTNNVILGRAKPASLSGTANTIINSSGTALSTGTNNFFAGVNAGNAATLSSNLIAIGQEALQSYNYTIVPGGSVGAIAIGYQALKAQTTNTQLDAGSGIFPSVALGYQAAYLATTTSSSVSIGSTTNRSTSIANCTAVGSWAGNGGNSTTAIGKAALNSVTGNDNSALGRETFYFLTTGTRNTGLGTQAGVNSVGGVNTTTGSDNVFAGVNATGLAADTTAAISLGRNAVAASNEFGIGSAAAQINTMLLGRGGASQTVANAVKIMAMRASGTTDTSMTLGTLTLAGSQGTGTGAGGDVIISTAPAAGVSGSTTNAHVERIRAKSATEVVVNDTGVDFDFRVEGDADANLLFVDAGTDRVGVGTSTPQTKLHAQQTSAATNTVTNILRVDSQSSGTPATGIGVGIEMAAETSAGNTEVGVVLEAVTTDVTAASEDFDLVVKNMTAGAAATEKLRVGADGGVTVKNGNLNLATAGNGIQIKTGTNATAGLVTGLSSVGSTTINTTQALTDSLIFVQPINTADKHGFSVSTIVNGTSFTVDFSGTYSGDLAWFIINQYPF